VLGRKANLRLDDNILQPKDDIARDATIILLEEIEHFLSFVPQRPMRADEDRIGKSAYPGVELRVVGMPLPPRAAIELGARRSQEGDLVYDVFVRGAYFPPPFPQEGDLRVPGVE